MLIDLKRCMGCNNCAVSCKIANNLPDDIWWNRVLTVGGNYVDTATGEYPNKLHMKHVPIGCQHCGNPPCVKACPTGATYKRKEDGIVVQDYDKCIGCRMCMVACPYNARSFNWKKPEYYVGFATGDADAAKHQYNVVEKCTFCINRISRGDEPACMELCPARARIWGDLDDPNSEISRRLKGKNYVRLLEEKGTDPAIYYIE
ncbi:4Fe-4S dicluster domain-containing protein [Cytobacillus sp. Hz8]|uniref:4Fe-4S dicluster domain-containing protein n=1 Tax=Cytobacillus sp. Hz8 TaxID=3347168 RepID=UPI0035D65B5C